MDILLENLMLLDWKQVVMWVIGGILIYLAIKKEMEPTLLLPMGFGAILVNLPHSGAVEVLETLFNAGIANELFPLILFIGIGANDIKRFVNVQRAKATVCVTAVIVIHTVGQVGILLNLGDNYSRTDGMHKP